MHDSVDKITELDGKKLMAAGGDTADRISFADLMQKKIIYVTIGTPSSFFTGHGAFYQDDCFRKSQEEACFCVSASHDTNQEVWFLDYLGVMQNAP